MARLAAFAAVLTAALAAAVPGGATVHRLHPEGPVYTVVDLGTLGGATSFATGINGSGWVVGYAATTGNAASHAFVWHRGRMTDLGTLPGGTNSRANAINDRGWIVGSSDALTPSLSPNGDVVAPQAFLFSGGKMLDIDPNTQSSYNPGSWAYGINDAGQIVGDVLAPSADSQAFLSSAGAFATLPLSGAEPQARGINDGGAIVGSTWADEAPPFLFAGGLQTNLGSASGQAEAINASGEIVGESRSTSGAGHAFLDSAGSLTDLGTLGGPTSRANALDASGRVVGTADVSDGVEHAFLYRRGAMLDLNNLIASSSGWSLETATGINRGGEIVGVGTHDGAEHAFLLVPGSQHRGGSH